MFDRLDVFLLELEQHDKTIFAGVVVEGPGAAYWANWEWGNTRQTKPGPKTVLGTNPDGTTVWLSAQAPFGFIRINTASFWDAVDYVMKDVDFNQPDAKSITRVLENAAKKISKLMTQIIQDSAPRDTGELASDIHPVDPGDSILDSDDTDPFETLLLEE